MEIRFQFIIIDIAFYRQCNAINYPLLGCTIFYGCTKQLFFLFFFFCWTHNGWCDFIFWTTDLWWFVMFSIFWGLFSHSLVGRGWGGVGGGIFLHKAFMYLIAKNELMLCASLSTLSCMELVSYIYNYFTAIVEQFYYSKSMFGLYVRSLRSSELWSIFIRAK